MFRRELLGSTTKKSAPSVSSIKESSVEARPPLVSGPSLLELPGKLSFPGVLEGPKGPEAWAYLKSGVMLL